MNVSKYHFARMMMRYCEAREAVGPLELGGTTEDFLEDFFMAYRETMAKYQLTKGRIVQYGDACGPAPTWWPSTIETDTDEPYSIDVVTAFVERKPAKPRSIQWSFRHHPNQESIAYRSAEDSRIVLLFESGHDGLRSAQTIDLCRSDARSGSRLLALCPLCGVRTSALYAEGWECGFSCVECANVSYEKFVCTLSNRKDDGVKAAESLRGSYVAPRENVVKFQPRQSHAYAGGIL